jgi:hypothetical protein
MFGLGNALWLAGWATFPDQGDVSEFAALEEYVSDATSADRMVAAGFVISAAAAVVGAVMVRTLSRQQSERCGSCGLGRCPVRRTNTAPTAPLGTRALSRLPRGRRASGWRCGCGAAVGAYRRRRR